MSAGTVRAHSAGPGPVHRLSERHALTVVGVLTVLGFGLRCFLLDRQGLWVDEVITYLSSRGSPWDVLTQTEVNTNIPPLYYLVVRAVMVLGEQESILRAPSVLFGSASIPLMYAVGRRLADRSVGVLGALLLACSPLHVWYSQEARPYAALVFLALLSVWLFEVARRERSWWTTAAFAVATAAVFLTHTVGVALIGALLVYALVVERERRVWWLATFGLIGLLCLPGVLRLLALPPTASAGFRPFQLAHLPYTFWTFSVGFTMGPSLAELHAPDAVERVLGSWALILPIAIVFGVLAVAGLVRIVRRWPPGATLLLLWLGAPVAFVALSSLVTRHPYNVRYTIVALPAFLLLVAVGIGELRRRISAPLTAAALIGVGFSLANLYWNPRYAKEDYRGAAEVLRQHARPGEQLVVTVGYVSTVLSYYSPGSGLDVLTFPPMSGSAHPREFAAAEVSESRPVWVLESRAFGRSPAADLLPYFRDNFVATHEFASTGVTLVRFVRQARESSPAATARVSR